jgi:hypothetical protein
VLWTVYDGTGEVAGDPVAIVLSRRNEIYRRLHERATRDTGADGIPDIYQSPT